MNLSTMLSRSKALSPLVKLYGHQQARHLRLWREKTIRLMYWRNRSFDRIRYPERRRDEMQDWNYRSEIFAFSRRLHECLHEDTLRQIFAHQSYIEKNKRYQVEHNLPETSLRSNQQLIVRGEQLLNECIKPYLRYHFNRIPEEGIEEITNYLKREDNLAFMSDWFGCKDIILTEEYPPSVTTKANTVRALLAGIEHDFDIAKVQRFVIDMIVSFLNDKEILDDVWIIPNPQATLNLILANSGLPVYEPRIMFQTGVRTLEPCYLVGLYVNKQFVGSSPGETLAIAEQLAALDALQRIFNLKDDRTPFIYGPASEDVDYKSYAKANVSIKNYKIQSAGTR